MGHFDTLMSCRQESWHLLRAEHVCKGSLACPVPREQLAQHHKPMMQPLPELNFQPSSPSCQNKARLRSSVCPSCVQVQYRTRNITPLRNELSFKSATNRLFFIAENDPCISNLIIQYCTFDGDTVSIPSHAFIAFAAKLPGPRAASYSHRLDQWHTMRMAT